MWIIFGYLFGLTLFHYWISLVFHVVLWSLHCRALQPKINPHPKVGANARGDNDCGVERRVCYLGLREDASVSKIVGTVQFVVL